MKKIITSIILVFAAFLAFMILQEPQVNASSRSYTKSIAYSPGKPLDIATTLTAIEIIGEQRNDILVEANVAVQIKASFFTELGLVKEDPKTIFDFFDRVDLSLKAREKDIYLGLTWPSWEYIDGRYRSMSRSGKMRIYLPSEQAVHLSNTFGDITVSDIKNGLRITNSHGQIKVQNCAGEHRISNRFGKLYISKINGNVIANNRDGEVVIEEISGDVWVENTFAAIKIQNVGNLSIGAKDSPIDAQEIQGDCKITSSFKPVVIKRTAGSIFVEGESSEITVSDIQTLPGDGKIELTTNFASINLSLPANVDAQIAAYSESGIVKSDFLATDQNARAHRAFAKLGTGSANIRLQTNQNIHIKKE